MLRDIMLTVNKRRSKNDLKPYLLDEIARLFSRIMSKLQGLVVQRVDDAIHRINQYPVDTCM